MTKKIFTFLLSSILTVVVVYVCYVIFMSFFGLLKELEAEILVAIISAMATVFVGVGAVIISQKQSKQRDIDESHRPKKVEIYKGFMDTVSDVFASGNELINRKKITEQELANRLFQHKTDILLWGSPKVIKCQLNFEKVSKENEENSLLAIDSLYKAIREDMGLSNKGLDNYELIKMYLSDPEELDKISPFSKKN